MPGVWLSAAGGLVSLAVLAAQAADRAATGPDFRGIAVLFSAVVGGVLSVAGFVLAARRSHPPDTDTELAILTARQRAAEAELALALAQAGGAG